MEVRVTLQLRESEVKRLTGELVQESMAFEDLRVTSEEKDASILQMRQEAETAHMDLKKEKKQVKGKVPPEPFVYRLVSPRFTLDPSPFFSRACGKLSGSRRRRWECSRWLMTPPSRS
jgi:hypothetical protein